MDRAVLEIEQPTVRGRTRSTAGMAVDLDPEILREYDIRGIVGESLNAREAQAIGRAFGTMVVERGGRSVVVGADGRLSSPDLTEALIDGLRNTGLEVISIGLGPTPMLYFANKYLDSDAGIMVTGSHNPSDYNGFKMVIGGAAIYGDAIQELGRIARTGRFARGSGKVREVSVLDTYVERLLVECEATDSLSIAWDSGNGAAGVVLDRLVPRMPGRHTVLNGTVDGRFPNHHPDPTVVENLTQLRDAVRDARCDLGIAFDGDGDRIGVIDGNGGILWGDQLLVLFARELLENHPGATVIADIKASQVLFDAIRELGGEPIMWRTGHSLIKAKMAECGALLAGEMSGHIFFADRYYGYDDALYAAMRLIGIVARSGVTLADLAATLPTVINTPELRLPCPGDRKFDVVEEVKERLVSRKAEVIDVDGVRVVTEDGWWLLRASNTQDVLVARCESTSAEGLDRLKRALSEQLAESGLEGVIDT